MKRVGKLMSLVLGLALLAVSAVGQTYAPGSFAGWSDVQQFGQWTAHATSAVAVGSSSMSLDTCYFALSNGPAYWFPLAVGENIKVLDSSGGSETVAITAVSAPTPSVGSAQPGYACGFTATFVNAHSAGVRIVSADGGLGEALATLNPQGGTVVLTPGATGITAASMAALLIYPNVQIVDIRGPQLQYWNPQPTSAVTTSTGAPATRVATATCPSPILATTVCDSAVAVASGGFTNAAQYVWVAYVDVMGGVSQASATAHYTSAGALSIFFAAPAAATGQVGYIVGVGTTYAAAYWFPMTSAYCTLTTIETVTPACALPNTAYGQLGASALIPKPLTTFALPPIAGGLANVYNPNLQNHTTFAYVPSTTPYQGFQTEYAAFNATPALTAGQLGVLGTVILPTGYLNWLPHDIEIHGKFNYTPTTGGTAPEVIVEIGDVTDFTTGTPKALCTELEVHTTTTATYNVDFTCTLQTQATGTTGSLQPGGFLIDGISTGAALGIAAPEQDTGAITADVLDQDLLYVVFLQTSSAETTGPTLQKLTINQIN